MSFDRAALVTTLLLAASGCTSSGSTSDPDSGRIDCLFVQDRDNCWRAFVHRVDDCLGQADGGVPLDAGQLAADGRSCLYAERTIAAQGDAQALDDPLVGATDPGRRDFTVMKAGRACLAFHQDGTNITLEAEGTKLSYGSTGGSVTLTCADGRVVRGEASDLLDCVSAGGGLPGFAFRNDGRGAWFTVLGMNSPLYDCLRNADAGR